MATKDLKPKAVIYDLDGCLSCNKGYSYMTPATWCWKQFLSVVEVAPVNKMVFTSLICHKHLGFAIILLTARPESLARVVTEHWLGVSRVIYDELLMMDDLHFQRHQRANTIKDTHKVHADFKRISLDKLQEKYNIVAAYDDQQDNIDMYVSRGIVSFKTVIP